MNRVVWTAPALDDLRSIREFINRDSPRYAQRVIGGILRSVRRLERFPDSGSVVPDYYLPAREILFGNYRVIYRVKNGAVEILAVIHAARDLPGV